MDLDSIGILKAITRRMDWIGERQRVLAENVANADTPNYKPRDLKPANFSELVQGNNQRMGLKVTAAGHFPAAAGAGSATWRTQKVEGTYEVAPNGNAVNLEEQMMRLAENQGDHNLMTNLYRKQVGLLRKALGPRQQ
ncbi:flagellar basal body rod protein FlgB [Ferrovibrio sp.]|uniref:flagellar basal body rod protein FlgB n=1 Tax=Ferrovibrio sp. TaxID=1917215 RepID=UPI0025BF789E|nr:flagellar basal body rod protein FlgB [Ferrovibrio sp.]MBX3455524.1 flagellar basal body rod protein FlgB [Ferrovibrio sp.]